MTCITKLAAALAAGASMAVALAAPPPDEPLEPEKAFPVSARLDSGSSGIVVSFRILPGYYLYADRFRFEISPDRLALGPLRRSTGEMKDDPFIGRTEILRHSAELFLPFAAAAEPGTYALNVTAQGCAEEKVCYAPFSQVVRLKVPAAEARKP